PWKGAWASDSVKALSWFRSRTRRARAAGSTIRQIVSDSRQRWSCSPISACVTQLRARKSQHCPAQQLACTGILRVRRSGQPTRRRKREVLARLLRRGNARDAGRAGACPEAVGKVVRQARAVDG